MDTLASQKLLVSVLEERIINAEHNQRYTHDNIPPKDFDEYMAILKGNLAREEERLENMFRINQH
jgi:hypothetical protein